MSRPTEFDALRAHGWLSETAETFRNAVLDRCALKRVARGETLYRAGDAAGGLYGLIDGTFGVMVAPGQRAPFLGILARPGFWIGEASVITRGPRAIGIVATRDSVVAHLPLGQWDAIVHADGQAWRWLAYLTLRNELFALAVIDALRMRRSEDRLAAILAILAEGPERRQKGVAEGLSSQRPIDISQDDLASMANLSRSSAGRILEAFEARGLISRSYRTVNILDLEGLRRRRGP